MSTKYDIGDIIQDNFTYQDGVKGGIFLIEDIDYGTRVVPVSYRLLDLERGDTVWWPIRLIDGNKNYVKVA